MAGKSKPNIKGLNKEAEYRVIKFSACQKEGDSTSQCGLFNGDNPNEWDTSNVFYWSSSMDYLEIEIYNDCSIWRSGSMGYIVSNNTNKLQILKWNEGVYEDVTNTYAQNVTAISNNEWEETIPYLPKGRYKFIYNGIRLDSEWYIEKRIYNKYLIKQNDVYYSFRPSFDKLGKPISNKTLEGWYKENGIDDLNTLIERKNSKLLNLLLGNNDIYKTAIPIDFNEIINDIKYINQDSKKEIEYNTEEYQLLDLIKDNIGNKCQITKWEES